MPWCQEMTLLFELTMKVPFPVQQQWLAVVDAHGLLPSGHNPNHPNISNYRVSSVRWHQESAPRPTSCSREHSASLDLSIFFPVFSSTHNPKHLLSGVPFTPKQSRIVCL